MVSAICVCELTLGLSWKGEIPWEFEADRAFFKEQTLGSPVIMGYHTYETLPGALCGRENYVITSKTSLRDGFVAVTSLEEALDRAQDPYVIGGAQLYNYALEYRMIEQIFITRMHRKWEADTFLRIDFEDFEPSHVMCSCEEYSIMRYRLAAARA